MIRDGLFLSFKDDERTVLADIRTWKTITRARDGATGLVYAIHESIENSFHPHTGNDDIDLASLGLARIVAA